jgi:hypothetical protein
MIQWILFDFLSYKHVKNKSLEITIKTIDPLGLNQIVFVQVDPSQIVLVKLFFKPSQIVFVLY